MACCRHLWHLLEDERSWRAVEMAEVFADDMCSNQELQESALAALPPLISHPTPILNTVRAQAAAETAIRRTPLTNRENHIDIGFPRDYPFMSFAEVVLECVRHELREWNEQRDLTGQYSDDEKWCLLLREISSGTHFAWLCSPQSGGLTPRLPSRRRCTNHVSSARCPFSRMLFKTLVATTKTSSHTAVAMDRIVRGCWVVDLVLGKE